MERTTWKQSPKQSVYDVRLYTKNPRYQKLHGAIGVGGAPPPLPGSELLLLLLLLLLWGCSQWNFVTAVGTENTPMSPLPECRNVSRYVHSFRHGTGTAYATDRRQTDVRRASIA